MADTGKTGSPDNMKNYGVKLGTGADYGDIFIYFRGKEAIYDGIKTELGLIDLSASPEIAMFPSTLKKGRLDFFATLHVTVVENTAGGDGSIDTKTIKIRCDPTKTASAAKGLKGKKIGTDWTVLKVAIC
jgi:hypothetical protein